MTPHWTTVTVTNAAGRPWTVDVWIAEQVITRGDGPGARDTRYAVASEARRFGRDVPVRRLPDWMRDELEAAVERVEGEYFDGFAWGA
ncbi:MAG: hypothetical protein FJ027_19040 [Candidatus Rokubacteria bacterium]|nr:hypothetical protein [Candidatus Rokubacteria bacterium]